MSEPITREETYLAAIAGDGVDLPNPITREEMYLAAAAGMPVELPNPITRKEQFLQRVVETGGTGGGGVTIRNQNKTITQNGQYKADSGYTGLGTVTVNVPQEDPVLQDKTITENGEYTADAGYTGLGKVTVNVAASGGSGGGADVARAIVDGTITEYIDNEVESVREYAFYGANSLTKVSMPNATTVYGRSFSNCKNLTDVYLPLWKTGSGYDTFMNCTSLRRIDLPSLTTLPGNIFGGCSALEEVSMPLVTALGGFTNCVALEEISFPNATAISDRAFQKCTSLKNIDIPKAGRIGAYSFENCTALQSVYFPSATAICDGTFKGCTELKEVRLGTAGGNITGQNGFNGCTALTTIVLYCPTLRTLQNVNAFDGTPFASGGTGGTVYCPAALITQYQQATNWATLYAAGTCNFVAIEGSEYE